LQTRSAARAARPGCTDFGLDGPYTGQLKAVLHQMAPGIPIIDLFADAPTGDPKPSAYLLAAYAVWFAAGTVFLCVVDPGVGGSRQLPDGFWSARTRSVIDSRARLSGMRFPMGLPKSP
jgi:hypothetical protein